MRRSVQKGLNARMAEFVRRCRETGLAHTHQRMTIYRVLAQSADHPSPDLVYERVRAEIPSISKATVYKNIRAFIEAGVLREVNDLHQTNRLDANLKRHHHLICTRCKRVADYQDEQLNNLRSSEREPMGFRLDEYRVEVRGLCPACRLVAVARALSGNARALTSVTRLGRSDRDSSPWPRRLRSRAQMSFANRQTRRPQRRHGVGSSNRRRGQRGSRST